MGNGTYSYSFYCYRFFDLERDNTLKRKTHERIRFKGRA